MDLNDRISSLKKYQLNCEVFSVYDYNGLDINELLCQFFTKINNCIDVSNKTLDLAQWLVNEGLEIEVAKKLETWLLDGTLAHIINEVLLKELQEKVQQNTDNIEILNNTVNDIENKIITIKEENRIQGVDIVANTNNIATNTTDITNLKNKVENIHQLPTFETDTKNTVSLQTMIDEYNETKKANNLKNVLRVGTFNIFGFRHKSPMLAKECAYTILKSKVDVCGLQELCDYYDFNSSWWIQTQNALDKMYSIGLMTINGGKGGAGILSGHELMNSQYGTFTPVPGKEHRGWTESQIIINNKLVKIYNTHFTHDNMDMLRNEMREMATAVKNDATPYKIVSGDFNTRTIADYTPFLEIGYQLSMDISTGTIDNILYHPSQCKLKNVEKIIVPPDVSDHDLVVAELELI